MTERADNLPRHIGVIMDGNGRWAGRRGLPRIAGHKKGAETFEKIVRYAAKLGVPVLTAYAFSTENWKRPTEEVAGIMDLLRVYLDNAVKKDSENLRIRVPGDISRLDGDLRERIARLERETAKNTGMCLNIALNYGGRSEIVHAAAAAAEKLKRGEIAAVDEETFADCLYTAGQPDVDLLIRTSGERRISNFLLWQLAYAELVFLDVLWPDFTKRHFDMAIAEYAARNRRLGGI